MGWWSAVGPVAQIMHPTDLNVGEDLQIARDHERALEHQLDQQRHEAVTRELDHSLTSHDSGGHHDSSFGAGY